MSGLGAIQATAAACRRFVRGGGGIARKGNAWLHPKHGPRFYYKGNRARRLGRHTRKGKYLVDWKNKVPIFEVPDIVNTELRPYVSASTPKVNVPPPHMD